MTLDVESILCCGTLVRAHRRGVRIRVLIDGFGGGFLCSSAYRHLRKQGVPVARFLHSTLPWKMPVLDLRLHEKSLVVDGDMAFVGGLNIGAENLIGLRPKAPVRDLHFRVEGAVVRQIEQDFEDDWSFTTAEMPIETDALRKATPSDGGAARTIVAGPDQEVDQLVLVHLSAINLARHSVKIATPYFLPDEQLVTALQLAALRGVEVDLVLPAFNNQRLVAWAANLADFDGDRHSGGRQTVHLIVLDDFGKRQSELACVVIAQEVAHRAFRSDIEADALRGLHGQR
jgi:cardiolipin synthase